MNLITDRPRAVLVTHANTTTLSFQVRRSTLVVERSLEKARALYQGEPGVGLEFEWRGTALGVRYTNSPAYVYVELGANDGRDGWAVFRDTQYTDAAPLQINETPQPLPINALSTILTYAAPEAAAWWDAASNKFKPPVIGADWTFRVDMKARALLAKRELRLKLDIGPPLGVIWGSDRSLSRESGVIVDKSFGDPLFSLETFVTNGGQFLISADGPVEIFDIGIFLKRHS